MSDFRIETDSLGEVRVPSRALWGAQTQRAVENFPISGLRMPRRVIRAFGRVKRACAALNRERGSLPAEVADAIILAAAEVVEGRHDGQFPVDIFQTGSGTSSNMNANEVIANRAIQIAGGVVGSKKPVHPNDHVNKGQSSNDVVPTVIHMAAAEAVAEDLIPALRRLAEALEEKAKAFDAIVKIGRTHLQDAVPVRLGQEFSGYAQQARNGVRRLQAAVPALCELALGGTAVGTGLNAVPGFSEAVIARLADETGLPLRQAPNLFEALAAKDGLVEASGALRTVAVSLNKIAEDVRWLGSGPRCGIGEIKLPDLQPGSSIMPGKVNPVMSEMMVMVCAQVMGNDLVVALSGQAGHFELNTMMPLMAHAFLQSVEILANACNAFTDRCVAGLQADARRCGEMVEKSLAMVTALNPVIGYDTAAALAHEAYETDKTIRELCLEKGILPKEKLDELLNARKMTGR
ncbi:MAG: class II fumarate hydratase [Acidobacteriota bacterium]